MRIVVLAGGLSMERNVSLSSGTRSARAPRAVIRQPWWICFWDWRAMTARRRAF